MPTQSQASKQHKEENVHAENEKTIISVIVPFHNAAKTLAKCLESVRRSKYLHYELIAVDDGSTDRSAQIAQQFQCKLVKTEKKSGAAYARNFGAEHAKGDILLYLDADVILKGNDILEKIEKIFRKPSVTCVNGIYAEEAANKGLFLEYRALQDYFWAKDLKEADYFTPACGAIRKELFQELGGFDTSYTSADVEEFEFGYRIREKAKILSLPEIQVYHHFSSFMVCGKNYFKRAYLWTKLFLKRRKFDNLGSTKGNAIGSLAGLFTLLLLLLAGIFSLTYLRIFIVPILLFSGLSFLIFLMANRKFFMYVLKKKGLFFLLYSMYNHLLLSVFISSGALLSFLDHGVYLCKRIPRTIAQMVAIIKPFFNRYPAYMILYITNRCNSKCKTCFYWDSLNKPVDDLTIEELEKIAKNYKHLVQLTLTGGEPTLRKDLPEIAHVFSKHSNVRFVTIPTNCLLPSRIADILEKTVKKSPSVEFTIPLSLDALHEGHDEIRGVKGNFVRLVETYHKLKALERRYNNIRVDVNTVVHKFNQDNIKDIFEWVEKNFNVRNHGICFTRGNPLDKETKELSLEKLKQITEFFKEMKVKNWSTKEKKKSWFAKLFDGISMLSNDLAIWSMENKRFKRACLAGKKLIIMGETGTVYPCEILPGSYSMGNIRDFDYDIKKLLYAQKGKETKAFIAKNACGACTFECALAANIVYDVRYWPELLKNVRRVYKKKIKV